MNLQPLRQMAADAKDLADNVISERAYISPDDGRFFCQSTMELAEALERALDALELCRKQRDSFNQTLLKDGFPYIQGALNVCDQELQRCLDGGKK